MATGTGAGPSNQPDQVLTKLSTPYVATVVAEAGNSFITHIAADGATEVDAAFAARPAGTAPYLIVDGGSNDWHNDSASGQQVYDALVAYVADRLAATPELAGRIIYVTPLPRSNTNTPAEFEGRRQAFLTLVRANPPCVLADLAANSTIGDAGDEENTTNYLTDDTHLTFAGREVAAAVMVAAAATVGLT